VAVAGFAWLGWMGFESGTLGGFESVIAGAPTVDEGTTFAPSTAFRTGKVVRRLIREVVTATGSLTPVALVSVSSQVSGQIKEIYADFNDEIALGTAIAQIDPTSFDIAVEQAEAELDMAHASVATQRATIDRLASDLETAGFDLAAATANTEYARIRADDAAAEEGRKQALGQNGPAADRERAHFAYLASEAQVRSAEAVAQAKETLVDSAAAQLRSAIAQLDNLDAVVRQRAAALEKARAELERTVIRAPVNGIIIQRSIEVGQTVAVSLEAPSLFAIAQDLRAMQVKAAIAEADIGRMRVGQSLEFTVDSYPGRLFNGQVIQIRKQPQTNQNVVTYTVVASAANPELLLLPGMTASATIIVEETESQLAVPNSALRFRPRGDQSNARDRVYIQQDGQLLAAAVVTGATDGAFTAIVSDVLREGDTVITGVASMDDDKPGNKLLFGLF
jgi:HlyD family secretion protein